MQIVIVGVVAAIVGILVGYWLREQSIRGEKALLEQRNRELSEELVGARSKLAASQEELAARAGHEAVAAERARALEALGKERDQLHTDVRTKTEIERQSAERISKLEADLNNERRNLQEKLAMLEDAKKALAHQFEAVAAEILEKKSKSFSEGSQKELGNLLAPLQNQIKEFREKVEQAQSDSKTGVTKLETLIGTLNGMNKQLAEEAQHLTSALRGSSKAQGDWGEFILRDLLEKTGLREGEQYSFQQSFADVAGEDGEKTKSARTDVIVSLPGNRHLVIDSKVSLTAYTEFANATDEEARKVALKQHLASIRGHVNGLAKSGYHQLPEIESPDFVVMFVPVEPAFLIALQNDSSLLADAYEQKILLVGPTTLLFVIRIVDVLWQQEAQSKNVKEVMDRGAKLYDKFVGFIADLEAVGKNLRQADQSYNKAMNKLSDGRENLVRQVEMLKGLGVRTGKSIPKNILGDVDEDELGFALTSDSVQDEQP